MALIQPSDKPSLWRRTSFRLKVGFLLVILANLCLGSILIVPFVNASFSTKEIVAAALFGIGEVLFYAGLFLVGKEVVQKYRKYLNPLNWFKKKDDKTGNL